MAAKVVVIIKNKDALIRPPFPLEKAGGGKAAQPTADDDEVIGFAGIDRLLRRFAMPGKRVSGIKRAGVIAPHSGQTRRINRRCTGLGGTP